MLQCICHIARAIYVRSAITQSGCHIAISATHMSILMGCEETGLLRHRTFIATHSAFNHLVSQSALPPRIILKMFKLSYITPYKSMST